MIVIALDSYREGPAMTPILSTRYCVIVRGALLSHLLNIPEMTTNAATEDLSLHPPTCAVETSDCDPTIW